MLYMEIRSTYMERTIAHVLYIVQVLIFVTNGKLLAFLSHIIVIFSS